MTFNRRTFTPSKCFVKACIQETYFINNAITRTAQHLVG